jgi:hypothetical protein
VPLIAGGAIATRDYFPGHHDKDAANGHWARRTSS